MDSLTGVYQIINSNQYPKCFDDIECDEYETVSQVYYYPPVIMPPNQNAQDDIPTVNENLQAVIIGTQDIGSGNPNDPVPNRFWYNTALIYNTLIEAGYSDENIIVHYHNGDSYRNLPDFNGPVNTDYHIDYAASRDLILETFYNLEGYNGYNSNNDIPKLGPSDQLFVYVSGHGGSCSNYSFIYCKNDNQLYDELRDYHLSQAIIHMECAQMTFMFQQCKSGNFTHELTNYNSNVACKNRIVHTATSQELYSSPEVNITQRHYGEFTYYWAAALRGYYPELYEPWEESCKVGDFPFPTDYPISHDPDYSPDTNEDGFVQFEEAFLYADDMDAWSENGFTDPNPPPYAEDEPISINTMGNKIVNGTDNLSTLYGLAGTVDSWTEFVGNRNYFIGEALSVVRDLDIFENANLYISGENAIIDVSDASDGVLLTSSGVTFTGNKIIIGYEAEIGEQNRFVDCDLTINGELETNSEVSFNNGSIIDNGLMTVGFKNTFNNCDINVNGNISFGLEEKFIDMSLYLNKYDLETVFDNSIFNNSILYNYGKELIIQDSEFNFCNNAFSYLGDVTVTGTYFNHTWLYLQNQQENEDFMATVSGCTFTNNTTSAIDLWNYPKFLISNNTIDGNFYSGMQIVNSGRGISGNQNIFGNEITNCTMSGIFMYFTIASIGGNHIHNNNVGIRLLNKSTVDIVGNPGATTETETQRIKDNDSYELYTTDGSFPWYIRHNIIIDEDNLPNDPLVYYDATNVVTDLKVEYNCWGNSFNYAVDLYPLNGFEWDPIWCPGGGGFVQEAAETLYLSGKAQYESANYSIAKSTFEMVINQYPDTKYASASMKDLFSVEKYLTNDYNLLYQYYTTNSVIQSDSILVSLADFLANKCDIEMENWQSAITHYENIINNPISANDSVFAIIDLGYLYINMPDSTGNRSLPTVSLIDHIPSSKESYYQKRDSLLSLLPFDKNINNSHKIDLLEGNNLLQNTPNPISSKTKVYYQLTECGEGKIIVVNSIGIIVKQVSFSHEAGLYNIELDMNGLPVGIYFYSMEFNGICTGTKKMVIVK